jgi:hypothetical protein
MEHIKNFKDSFNKYVNIRNRINKLLIAWQTVFNSLYYIRKKINFLENPCWPILDFGTSLFFYIFKDRYI